jgi:hypothetical protein
MSSPASVPRPQNGAPLAAFRPKYPAPTFGILATGVVTLPGRLLLMVQLASEGIDFRALPGFMFVNLRVISYYILRSGERARLVVTQLAGAGRLLRMPLCFRESLGHREAFRPGVVRLRVAVHSLANSWISRPAGRWRCYAGGAIESEFTY